MLSYSAFTSSISFPTIDGISTSCSLFLLCIFIIKKPNTNPITITLIATTEVIIIAFFLPLFLSSASNFLADWELSVCSGFISLASLGCETLYAVLALDCLVLIFGTRFSSSTSFSVGITCVAPASIELLALVAKLLDGLANAIDISVSISVAVWYLVAVDFSIAFIIISFKALLTDGFTTIGSTGTSWICFNATDTADSASKGNFPVAISYITTPSEYKSDLASV